MALRAICIGINDYPGTSSDLHGCVNDAGDWAEELQRRGFDVSTLLNRGATGAAIRRNIRKLISTAEPGDVVVIQFSGHGSYLPDVDGDESDGADECICPYDLNRGCITDDELFGIFSARMSGVNVVMISDSCHSGTIGRFAPNTTPPPALGVQAARRRVRFLPPASFLDANALRSLAAHKVRPKASLPGRHAALTLTGCQDAEFSYDAFFRGRANGAFTYVALDALRTLPSNATYRQWHAAIRRRLPSSEYPQTPALFGLRELKDQLIFSSETQLLSSVSSQIRDPLRRPVKGASGRDARHT